jgi:hypothetical protein
MDRTRHVLTATLRSNPHYELVAFDRLSPSEQALLGPLTADADFHGVLRPRSAETPLPIKAVSHDTARLVRLLEQPGDAAHAVGIAEQDSNAAAQAIARLILDGVLEIQHEPNVYVGGVAAAPLIITRPVPDLTTTVTARLSLAALQYAAALPIDDPLTLSARMYFYNRTPVSPHWRRRYADPATIDTHLGLGDMDRLTLPPLGWTRTTRAGHERDGWFLWRRAGATMAAAQSIHTHKLYVSARHESLRDVVNVTLPILSRSPATAFKVGSTEQQLCRPDKLVAYFDSHAALRETATSLAHALRGTESHGVPFTAAITDDGLLSWGVDPPDAPQVMWRENESWRLWVTNRLAIALVSARRAGTAAMSAWEFAVVRLELDGVDATTWAPDPSVWSADAAVTQPAGA